MKVVVSAAHALDCSRSPVIQLMPLRIRILMSATGSGRWTAGYSSMLLVVRLPVASCVQELNEPE